MSSFAALLFSLLFLLFRVFCFLCLKLRLGLPLAYVVVMNTVLFSWANEHIQLVDTILFVLIGLCVLSWVVTFIRFLRRRHGVYA